MADVTTANVHDSKGVGDLMKDLHRYYPTISLVKADKGYQGIVGCGTHQCVAGELSAPMPQLRTLSLNGSSNDLFCVNTLYASLRINSYTLTLCKNTNIQLLNQQLSGARPLVGAFLRSFRSRWNPIAPSKFKENPSTIDRPAINTYCRTGS